MQWVKRHGGVLLVLLVMALVSKLGFFLTHRTFSQDEVRAYLYINNLIQRGEFYIPLGPAPAGGVEFAVPPLYYYLFLGAQLVSGGYFYSMTILIIVLESFTPLIFYFYLTRIFGEKKGMAKEGLPLGLSLLYLLSPLVLQYSTSTWNPNLVPFFSMLFLVSSSLLVLEKKWWGLVGAMVAMVMLVNLHFQWFVLVPVILIDAWWTVKNWRKAWQPMIVGLGLSLVLLSPYLYYELTHDWVNVGRAVTYLTSDAEVVANERLRKPRFYLLFFPGFYTRVLSGNLINGDWNEIYHGEAPTAAMMGGSGLFFLLLAVVAIREWRIYRRERGRWLMTIAPVIIFGACVLTLRLYKGDKPDYFLLTFLPYIFIFLGLGMEGMGKWGRVGLTLILVVELGGIASLPLMDGQGDYREIVAAIEATGARSRAIVPLQQELKAPLLYFFEEEEILGRPDPEREYNFLICFAYQGCENYQVNEGGGEANFYKYDLVTPEDYSELFPGFQESKSGEVVTKSVVVKIIGQNLGL